MPRITRRSLAVPEEPSTTESPKLTEETKNRSTVSDQMEDTEELWTDEINTTGPNNSTNSKEETDTSLYMEAAENLGEEETDTIGNMEAAEDTAGLMTDMKLEDSTDEFRNTEPGFKWTYFIEIYPWHADDMTDKFVKLIKLAEFARVVMRKKKDSNEKTTSEEKTKPIRQRMGCLQFYLQSRQSAKAVMRSLTWKTMTAKEFTIEITRRDPSSDTNVDFETAYMEVNTYPLCKCRFREKGTGELKDRSTRVSKIPGEITRGFLEVVLTRAFPVVGGAADKSFAAKPFQKLEDNEDFKGVLEYDCMSRGSARSFVQAHKRIILNGQELTIAAVDEQTMVEPTQPIPDPNKSKKKEVKKKVPSSQDEFQAKGTRGSRGRGTRGAWRGSRGGLDRGALGSRGYEDFSGYQGGIQPLIRPFTSPMPRNGPGMPLVMTGRQKMNEKLRTGIRVTGPGSIGDSFKAEISNLQNQLTQSTQALQEKIALLQGREEYYESDMSTAYDERPASYNDRAGGYDSWSHDWDEEDYGYDSSYAVNNTYPVQNNYPVNTYVQQQGHQQRGGPRNTGGRVMGGVWGSLRGRW